MAPIRWFAGLLVVCALVLTALGSPPALEAARDPSPPAASPVDEAAAAYDRGLKARDKAWELEQKAAEASGGERDKLLAKADKEYKKAARAFTTATETNPRMHQAWSGLGYALRKSGDYVASLEAYDRALELAPGYPEAIEYRAEAYLGLDRLDEAKEAYMALYRSDRQRAEELMGAMRRWVERRTADPGSLDPAAVEAFAAWVEERSGAAAQAALGPAATPSW